LYFSRKLIFFSFGALLEADASNMPPHPAGATIGTWPMLLPDAVLGASLEMI
jgi:hypothetical protein